MKQGVSKNTVDALMKFFGDVQIAIANYHMMPDVSLLLLLCRSVRGNLSDKISEQMINSVSKRIQ